MSELTLDIAKKLVGENASITNKQSNKSLSAEVKEIIESSSSSEEWENFTIILSTTEEMEPDNQGLFEFSSGNFKGEQIFITPNSGNECEIVISRRTDDD